MHSEGLWDSPEPNRHSNFDTLGHGYLSEATVRAIHAYQAWNRAAEPDFEIGQERKCLRSRGQRRETSFSQSGSHGGPAPRPADCRQTYRQFESRSIFLRYQ